MNLVLIWQGMLWEDYIFYQFILLAETDYNEKWLQQKQYYVAMCKLKFSYSPLFYCFNFRSIYYELMKVKVIQLGVFENKQTTVHIVWVAPALPEGVSQPHMGNKLTIIAVNHNQNL